MMGIFYVNQFIQRNSTLNYGIVPSLVMILGQIVV